MANFLSKLTGGSDDKDNERMRAPESPFDTRGSSESPEWFKREKNIFDGIQAPEASFHDNKDDMEWSLSRNNEDKTIFGKVFDVLQRGQYASANVAQGILEGDSDLAQRAWEGLSGEEKASYVDILRQNGIPWAPVLGTALDIGLDPFTYMGGPLDLFRQGVANSGLTSGLDDAMKALRGNIPGGETVGTVVDWLGDTFNPNRNVPKEITETFFMENYGMRADQSWAGFDISKKIGNITDDQAKAVTQFIEDHKMPTDPDMASAFNSAMDVVDDVTKKAEEFRHVTHRTVEKSMEDGKNYYLPHILKPHLDDWANGGSNIFGSAKLPKYATERTTDMNIKQFKALSDDFKRLSELDNVDDMRKRAQEMLDNDNFSEFTDQSFEAVESMINGADSASDAKGNLHNLAMQYEPEEDIRKILAMSKRQQAQARHQDNMLNFTLEDSNDADNWRRKLTSKDFDLKDNEKLVVRRNHMLNALDEMDELNQTEGLIKSKILGSEDRTSFFDMTELSPEEAKTILGDEELMDRAKSGVYALDEEVYGFLDRAEKMYSGTEEKNPLLDLYDKALGKWKKMATIWRPPFHARNAISNQAFMYEAGMDIPDLVEYGKRAASIQRGGDDAIEIAGRAMSADEWKRFWSGKGVRGWGYIGEFEPSDVSLGAPSDSSQLQDLKDTVGRLLTGESQEGDLKRLVGAPSDVGGWLGHVIEDNSRMGLASWKLEDLVSQGMDFDEAADEAAQHAWKHMFQYDQLTDVEKGTFKRLFPFYTFTRKNVQLQAEKLITDPVRMKRTYQLARTPQFLNPNTDEEKELMPEYMEGFGYFKIPDEIKEAWGDITGVEQDPDEPVYANMEMPWESVNRLLESPARTLMSSLSPASIPLQTGLNVSNFPVMGEPIEEYDGEMVPAPAGATFLPTELWKKVGMKPMESEETGKQVLGMPVKALSFLEDAIPPLREINQMFPQEGSVDLEESDAPWTKLKYMTGINFTPVDKEEQRYYREIDHNEKLESVSRQMSQLGRNLTKEELEAIMER